MMDDDVIVISIVSHDQQILVNRLLNSISDFMTFKDCNLKIYITENTQCAFNLTMPKGLTCHFHQNLWPKGFGQNHNSVFEKTNSDFFGVLNPDLIFTKAFNIDDLVSEMKLNNLSLISPKILNTDGSTADFFRSNLTFLNIFLRKFLGANDSSRDWLAGMCLFVNSRVFRQLRGFDEKFFMYVEDCDLSLRLIKAGYKLNSLDKFEVMHDAQRSSRRNPALFISHVKSLLYFWVKNLKSWRV